MEMEDQEEEDFEREEGGAIVVGAHTHTHKTYTPHTHNAFSSGQKTSCEITRRQACRACLAHAFRRVLFFSIQRAC
jgi:hypothetical protein